jgi:hypothetical protein
MFDSAEPSAYIVNASESALALRTTIDKFETKLQNQREPAETLQILCDALQSLHQVASSKSLRFVAPDLTSCSLSWGV